MSRLFCTFGTGNEIVTDVSRETLKPKSRKGTKKMTKNQRERIKQTAKTFGFELIFEDDKWIVYKTKYLTNFSLTKLSRIKYQIEPRHTSNEIEIWFLK